MGREEIWEHSLPPKLPCELSHDLKQTPVRKYPLMETIDHR